MSDILSLLDEARYAGRCWAVLPDVLYALEAAHDVPIVLSEDMRAQVEATEAANKPKTAAEGKVAIVPLKGVITPEGSLLAQLFGFESGLKMFRSSLSKAVADDSVTSIVMNVDSPGGIVDQVPETAAFIRSAAEKKPIVAVANPMAASAAYWLASNATQFVGSTSSETGSIGVYQLHRDITGANEKMGIKATLISAGKYKTEGNPFEPLGDEAKAAAQEAVNDFYDLFVADVAAGRGVSERKVRNGLGEGRVLTAHRAKEAGLIDTVGTLDNVVGTLAAGRLPSRRRAEDGSVTVAIDGETVYQSQVDEPKTVAYSTEEKLAILSALA